MVKKRASAKKRAMRRQNEAKLRKFRNTIKKLIRKGKKRRRTVRQRRK